MMYLAFCFQMNRSLRKLSFSDNTIDDDGARLIAQALKVFLFWVKTHSTRFQTNTNLEEVTFGYSELATDVAKALADALKVLYFPFTFLLFLLT